MTSPFNSGQQALIDAPVTSPVIGVAGAGTGKTTTILARTKRLMAEYQTGNILLITFTRAAANDIRTRLEAELPDEELPFDNQPPLPAYARDLRRISVGTFHSIIGSYIRKHATEVGLEPNFSIIDENSTNIMFRNLAEESEANLDRLAAWAMETNDTKLAKKHFNLLANTTSVLVNTAEPEELVSGQFGTDTLYRLCKFHRTINKDNVSEVASFCYEMFKASLMDGARTNTITYDQVLFLGYLMAKQDVLKEERETLVHTIVDEYQDTNPLQDAFIRYLAGERLTIVGDVDQSIYEFRGGRPALILDHAKEASVYNLTENYRSYQPILDVANRVIQNNTIGAAIRKDLSAVRGGAPECRMDLVISDADWLEADEVIRTIKDYHEKGVSYPDMAILIRSRMTLPTISRKLTEAHIPVYDTTKYADFMKSDVLVDTLNFLKVFVNPKDIYAFLGVIDRPKQGIGPVAIQKLNACAEQHNMCLVEYLLSKETSELTPALRKKIQKFVGTYESVIQGKDHTDINLSGLIGYLHTSFGYEDWLMSLKNKDRYARDLITLRGMVKEFEERYAAETPNATLYDLANAFVFDMSAVSIREEQKDGVCITTVHNAKGLEWKHVFLLGLEEENFPGTNIVDNDDMESERRLLYVALTRAKDSLHLYAAKQRVTSGDQICTPSRFLGELKLAPTKALRKT